MATKIFPTSGFADITGQATVIDGGTIEIHDTRIRLHRIEAPESGQFCMAAGHRWRCGQLATLTLADKIGRRRMRYGATCDPLRASSVGQGIAV